MQEPLQGHEVRYFDASGKHFFPFRRVLLEGHKRSGTEFKLKPARFFAGCPLLTSYVLFVLERSFNIVRTLLSLL